MMNLISHVLFGVFGGFLADCIIQKYAKDVHAIILNSGDIQK